MELPWAEFKTVTSGFKTKYIDRNNTYFLFAYDGAFVLTCKINKDDAGEASDFDDNYKSTYNETFELIDSDGATLSRVKMFKTGAAVRFHFFSFKTADLDSLHHRKLNGSDNWNFFTYKIYDESNVEITDPANEVNAVKTVLDFEPVSIDYEIVGGKFYQVAQPGSNIYVHVIGVPDVPEAYGGSVPFVSDTNLKILPAGIAFETNGRVPKLMRYHASNHTSKLRFIFYHGAGVQHECMGELEVAY